ncbi:MAG: ribose-phosphate pyrophosphokinase [Cytophagales bacterium]|jgi:ribose-phosphate pyrophosphokinase|nr:ribose-phosphate pyrophosphokinase [Cytophagales bacterium]MCA6368611.1 ribose-phosphate pyrophosphokinase [Cytophagales bacterium]MCA6370227.1 ribose-phosphate pyrophosphokinase [Cytophagales bacterium]MCA6374634.1 ribose-phosphate pyrophosphokinase [Cytophagales bacterium]MCA6381768.1 ribose-phosphate pyrophosphokinase [Cytophagales bacterium]
MSVKIFSGRATTYLAEKIANAYGERLGTVDYQQFSDGEMSPLIGESVRGHDVFIVQSTFAPADNFLELLLLIDAAKRASALNVNVIIPYFGYARQDRKDKPRVAIAAKLIANLISASGASRIMTCDLHADQIQGFFDIPVDHLDGNYIFVPYVKSLNLPNIMFATPDVGGIKRARSFAKFFNAELAVCDKYRKEANKIESMRLIGEVEGKDVILIDDLVDTAGTICKAAALLKEKGASSVRAICTHAVLSGKAYENIQGSVLEELVVSDTIPLKQQTSKIKVLSVSDLFAKAIRKIHDHESISSLFIRL